MLIELHLINQDADETAAVRHEKLRQSVAEIANRFFNFRDTNHLRRGGRIIRANHFSWQAALPQKSISVVTSFVFSSCDFVDRSFCPEN